LQKTNIFSTALVGVFTNKRLCRKQISSAPPLLAFSPTSVFAENKYLLHRPCWCFHQQASLQKTNIFSTALVGVFTNKRLCRKQISSAPPLLMFSPTSVFAENKYLLHRPCWCFHQQVSLQKTNIFCTALVGVFTNKRISHSPQRPRFLATMFFLSTLASDDAEKKGWWFVKTQTTGTDGRLFAETVYRVRDSSGKPRLL
jgi:uncharacterized protein YneF (UPF0154 family)